MGIQSRLKSFIENPMFAKVIMAVIIFNAALLGMETSGEIMSVAGDLILFLDKLCLAVFVTEILAKLAVYRFRFFRDGWNIFDFVIVGVSLLPVTQGFSALRALRILRVLRLISTAPRLRRVVEGFITALPGMASVFALMALIFYIGSVIATKLFATSFPDWFGTLGLSAYSLFQIMTLESWSMGIVRPVMEIYPLAWLFFIPFIMVTTFAVVNLLVGLIVNSMQDAHHEETNAETDAYRDGVKERLSAIEKQLDKLLQDRDKN